jgi:hypothetical protein
LCFYGPVHTQVGRRDRESMASVREKVKAMQQVLSSKAPSLCPRTIPSQFGGLVGKEGLLSLCSTQKQAEQGEAFLDTAAKNAIAEGLQGPRLVMDLELDLDAMEFKIVGSRMAGEIEATLCCLERYMELLVNAEEPDELEAYVEKFLKTNRLSAEAGGQVTMQEVYSLAYAIKVALSNMQGWEGYAAGRKLPLASNEDFSSLLRDLFENVAGKKKSAGHVTPKKSPIKKAKRGISGKKIAR